LCAEIVHQTGFDVFFNIYKPLKNLFVMKKNNLISVFFVILFLSGCSIFHKTTPTPLTVIKPIASFEITPDKLSFGDSIITVTWNANSDTILINGVQFNDSIGKEFFVIDTTTTFELTVIKDGLKNTYTKQVVYTPPIQKSQVTVTKTNISKNHIYSTGDYDGRFTLGTVSGYRLMYGFPNPRSTSHFVFTVDDYYASNGPNLHENDSNVVYFQGDLQTSENKYNGNNRTEVLFMFDSVYVMQIIEPVDSTLKPVDPGNFGNFMHITYLIVNKSGATKKIGLLALMDMMIDDNDRAHTYISGQKITNEQVFTGNNIPSSFKNLKTTGVFAELHATTLFTDADLETLDALAIGNWPHFYNTVWDINPTGDAIGDIAYLLKWNKQYLAAHDSISFSYYIGIETEPVTLIFNEQDIKNKSQSFTYSALGKTDLTALAKDSLMNFVNSINSSKIQYITIDGYADAYGGTVSNQKISVRRANKVMQILVDSGFDKNDITVKGNGESFASQDIDCQQNGKKADRKVKISIFYKD